jgi:hypothetical protein
MPRRRLQNSRRRIPPLPCRRGPPPTSRLPVNSVGGILQHSFGNDALSYRELAPAGIRGRRHVTDSWLASLARRRGGRAATRDLAPLHPRSPRSARILPTPYRPASAPTETLSDPTRLHPQPPAGAAKRTHSRSSRLSLCFANDVNAPRRLQKRRDAPVGKTAPRAPIKKEINIKVRRGKRYFHRLRPRPPQIGDDRHQGVDHRPRPGLGRHPGLQFPRPVRKQIEVNGGRESPKTALRMEEPVMVEMILHVDDKNGRKPDYRSPISAPSSASETAYRPNTFSELCLGVGGRGVNPHDDQRVWAPAGQDRKIPPCLVLLPPGDTRPSVHRACVMKR